MKGDGFERKIDFDKDPIRFKETAQLESPNLMVEFNDELHFDLALGDLIHNKSSVLKERIFTNNFSLLNYSLAPIEFDININEPFSFVHSASLTKKHTLKPKAKLKVKFLYTSYNRCIS